MDFFVMLIVAPRRKKVNASHFRPRSLQDRRERINAPPQSYNRGNGYHFGGRMFMQKKWKQLLACLAAPLAAGGLSVCG